MICPNCEYEVNTASGMCTTCGAQAVEGPSDESPEGLRLEQLSPTTPLEVSGLNGQIKFDGQSVIISRKGFSGFVTQGLKGSKEIPVKSIVSIQLKKGGALVNGYIQFATASGESSQGVNDAVSDENTVMYTSRFNHTFESLKNLISEAMHRSSQGSPTSAATASPAEQLTQLAALLEKGLLTAEEFQAQKQKLLGL
mgnify:CR=1 FL=1